MIRSNVVRNEIENQPHASLGQLPARLRQAERSAEMLIDYVSANAVWGTYVVFGAKIGKGTTKAVNQTWVAISNGYSRRTPFPNAH